MYLPEGKGGPKKSQLWLFSAIVGYCGYPWAAIQLHPQVGSNWGACESRWPMIHEMPLGLVVPHVYVVLMFSLLLVFGHLQVKLASLFGCKESCYINPPIFSVNSTKLRCLRKNQGDRNPYQVFRVIRNHLRQLPQLHETRVICFHQSRMGHQLPLLGLSRPFLVIDEFDEKHP